MDGRTDVVCCRFSSELQRTESNLDQERRCREHLERLGIPHARFLVIADEAIDGSSEDRAGLQQIKDLIYSNRLGILICAEQSRLSRGDNAKALIKDIVFHGGRFIAVTEGIDTAQKGWELLVGFSAVHHAQANRDTAERVRGGQEGRVLDANGSAGDFPYGYRSEYADPTAVLAYRGRGPKPKKIVVIDDAKAAVVRQVFARFVANKSISEIVGWLNSERQKIPRIGNRSGKGRWHHQHVRRILANEKYIGVWRFGRTTRLRSSSGNKKQVPHLPYQKETMTERPSLRLVDQPTWDAAQARLRKLLDIYGMREHGKKRGPSQHYRLMYAKSLLQGIVSCRRCGSRLQLSSSNGVKRLGCPNHRAGACTMAARVPHAKAEAEIMRIVQDILGSYPAWLAAAISEMRAAIQAAAQAAPDELTSIRARLAQVEKEIAHLVDALASGVKSAAVSSRLDELENEKVRLDQKSVDLEKVRTAEVKFPSDDWIRQQLADLNSLLKEPEQASQVMKLVRSLIGNVVAEQVTPPGKKRGYTRLHFRIDGWPALVQVISKDLPLSVVAARNRAESTSGTSEEFVIELGGPTTMDRWGPQIVQWRREHLKWKEIARRTGLKMQNAYLVWRRLKDNGQTG